MLMPSASASSLDRNASTGLNAALWDAIEAATAANLDDRALAQAWIAAAQSSASLARRLVVASSARSDPSVLERLEAFARRPDWRLLAESLSQEDRIGPSSVARLARLASAVAETSGWCEPQAAYWHCLCSLREPTVCLDAVELEAFDAPERCAIVARWCVDSIPERFPSLPSTYSRREATAALDSLSFDVTSILSEATLDHDRPTHDLSESACRRLACLARLAAYHREERWVRHLDSILASSSAEGALDIAGNLLGDWIGERWAIWLQTRDDKHGLARWVLPGSNAPLLGCHGLREDLERSMLPACYRWSRDLVANSGTPLARVYAEGPMEGASLHVWLDRLGRALASIAADSRSAREQLPFRLRSLANGLIHRGQALLRTAIGEFSAGAGHEIHNPLGAIAGHAARLLRDETDPDRRHALQQITAQTGRIRRMIGDLQLIGGEHTVEGRVVPIAEVLESAARKAEERLSSGRRTFESCTDDWRVRGDASLLSRMLAEIVVNGAEAAGPDGHVQVRVQRSDEDAPIYEIVVTDTGPGFSSTQRHNAFVPFYSGREAGRGLGMGLAVADRIARDHGGEIMICYSRPTTLRVLLPAA